MPGENQSVSEWLVPTDIRELRAFVVLASYYRRLVQNSASIAAPLHALMKSNQRFIWGDKEQRLKNSRPLSRLH